MPCQFQLILLIMSECTPFKFINDFPVLRWCWMMTKLSQLEPNGRLCTIGCQLSLNAVKFTKNLINENKATSGFFDTISFINSFICSPNIYWGSTTLFCVWTWEWWWVKQTQLCPYKTYHHWNHKNDIFVLSSTVSISGTLVLCCRV